MSSCKSRYQSIRKRNANIFLSLIFTILSKENLDFNGAEVRFWLIWLRRNAAYAVVSRHLCARLCHTRPQFLADLAKPNSAYNSHHLSSACVCATLYRTELFMHMLHTWHNVSLIYLI